MAQISNVDRSGRSTDTASTDTAARLLKLLSLLQSRPVVTGPVLADRLDVTVRCVRRDVARLRNLGYPVESDPGPTGGYRLGPGGQLPPLLFDDEEAVTVWAALAATSGGAVPGFEERALSALGKIDRLLPTRLRQRVDSLRDATVRLDSPTDDAVDVELLVVLGRACAGGSRLHLTYVDKHDRRTDRRVDPHRLVATGRRWYLVAFDADRDDWRTFRVDRIAEAADTGHRVVLPDPPDAAKLVARSTSVSPYTYTAVVRVHATEAELRRRVPPTVGLIEAETDSITRLTTGSDSLPHLAGHLVGLDLPFEVLDPPELAEHLRKVGRSLVAEPPG